MADIFVSYARQDKARVAPLVAALEAQGWSIWWDREITPGQEFDEQITREIEAARAVIVVWTPASVGSRWVRGEARLAADRGTLVPVRFEAANLPLDVRAIHTTEMDDWKENAQGIAFQELLRALGPLLKISSRTGGGLPGHAQSAQSEREGISICVLPFANMSNDAEQEYFSDGISEDIITDLSKVSALAVIARNSAFTFKGKHVDLLQVARQLKVSHVLEGSVRKSGNRVRITAQLINGATNDHVWAERYDRDLSDIFALQDEISQAIVAALKLKLFPEEKKSIEDRGTTNVEAYDKYLRARALHHQLGPGLMRAAEIYREALAIDPSFALAWYGLRSALYSTLIYVVEDSTQVLKEIAEADARVAALAPDTWWSHAMRADQCMMQRRWSEAEAAAKAALSLAPPSVTDVILPYASLLLRVGRIKEAVEYFLEARHRDPLSLSVSSTLQIVLDYAGRTEKAQAEFERSKDLSGDRDISEVYALFRALAAGDRAAIMNQMRRTTAHEGMPLTALQDLRDIFDKPETMLDRIRQAFPDPTNQDATRQTKIAMWAAHYGDMDLAMAALTRRSAIDPSGGRVGSNWHPLFAPLRNDPRFKDLLRSLNIDEYWRKTGNWCDFARPIGDDDFEVFA